MPEALWFVFWRLKVERPGVVVRCRRGGRGGRGGRHQSRRPSLVTRRRGQRGARGWGWGWGWGGGLGPVGAGAEGTALHRAQAGTGCMPAPRDPLTAAVL